MIDTLHYGVCYYPEHWPESAVDDDVSRIRDNGFDYVRVGEGAWAYFEPAEGQFRFDLFDRVVDACQDKGLKIVFGTPTYTGPAWIGHAYPEVYRHNFQRLPMTHGGRRNFNYTSPKYLERCDAVVTALAEHYARAKPVIAWQIDNEFNCHMAVSYAPSDTLAFREWLKKRHKTLDGLNAAWGTKFWSQTYDAWEQIDLPHPTVAYNNPSQILDEKRFVSDTVIAFCRRQADILRRVNPRWRLTHNGLFDNVDGPALVKEVDFWSHDQYPPFWNDWTGYNVNLIQSRALGFPFAVQEQQSGPGGQMGYLHATPRPGQLRLWAMQSFAHGAKMLGYFCWKTCPFGSEQHWHGLLEPDNKSTRRLAEAKALGDELRALPKEIWDAPVDRGLAVLRDYDNETNANQINTYVKAPWEPKLWTAACGRAHLSVDMTYAGSDWAGYRVLVAPHLRIVDANLAAKYEQFVRAGGTLVLSAQSATKDRNLHSVKATPPGLLRRLAGVEVEDWTNAPGGEAFACVSPVGPVALVGFVERLRLRGAEAVAHWTHHDPLLADAPAVTYVAPGPVPDPVADPEWAARIRAHRDRRPAHWTTIETADVVPTLRGTDHAVLLDCLGTWLTALIDGLDGWNRPRDDWAADWRTAVTALVDAWRSRDAVTVAVTNEVGWGVVPAHASGRLFADLLGRTNAEVAAVSDDVVLLVAGRPLHL